jgi:hypothetical protein
MEENIRGFISYKAAKKWQILMDAIEESPEIPPCQTSDPDAWFIDDGTMYTQARQLCKTCPVRALCADYAIENREPHGLWGGLSPRERMKIRADMGFTRGGRRAA